MSVEVVPVDTAEALEDLFTRLPYEATEHWTCFDLETRADESNFEEWHPSSRIVSVSLSWEPTRSYVVPLSHPAAPWSRGWQAVAFDLFTLLKDREPRLVAHNGKFDCRWVEAATGIDLSPLLAWDTMAGAFLLDENQSHRLKDRCVADLGVERWDDVDLKDAERAPWDKLAKYNALDTAHCLALSEWQRSKLRTEQPALGRVMWHVLMPTLRSLMRIERNGLLLDHDETERRRVEAEADRDRLYLAFEEQVPRELAARFQQRFREQQLFDLGPPTGSERLSLAPTSKFFKAYAAQSWPRLADTGTGAASWDAAVLKRLAARGFEDARLLVGYRKVDTQLTNFLTKWPHKVGPDGRMRASYKATTVVTGRLACENPNLQQVDRKLKGCFRASPGMVFVQADQSQVELRLAAWLSGDENLRSAYTEGRDVHRMTAAAITGRPEAEVTDEDRYRAKAVNFGFLYCQLAKGFQAYAFEQYGLDIALEESEDMRSRFFTLYPGLLDYHERIRRELRRNKQVVSPFGRVRRLPEIDSKDQMKRWGAERQAINHPIQSGASDILLMGLNAIMQTVDQDECQVVGTAHDSVMMEVREDLLDTVIGKIGPLMVAPPDLRYFAVDIPVPLVVEFEVGERWGAAGQVLQVSSGEGLLRGA